MPPATDGRRSEPSFRDDNYPSGFKEYIRKVWRETPWITTCYTIPYHGQVTIKRTSFYLEPGHMENGREIADRIIGTYVDHSGFGARFVVLTTGNNKTDLVWDVDHLNRRYGNSNAGMA